LGNLNLTSLNTPRPCLYLPKRFLLGTLGVVVGTVVVVVGVVVGVVVVAVAPCQHKAIKPSPNVIRLYEYS